jgi:hypothetical protein
MVVEPSTFATAAGDGSRGFAPGRRQWFEKAAAAASSSKDLTARGPQERAGCRVDQRAQPGDPDAADAVGSDLGQGPEQLIPKAVVQQQASYLLVAVRQKILSVPQTHARRILNLSDYGKAREVLKAIMTGLLCELQDLPDKVTDPNWLGAGVGSVVPSRGELP